MSYCIVPKKELEYMSVYEPFQYLWLTSDWCVLQTQQTEVSATPNLPYICIYSYVRPSTFRLMVALHNCIAGCLNIVPTKFSHCAWCLTLNITGPYSALS
jgi:hypothetical protein